jgi:hypothetical protein
MTNDARDSSRRLLAMLVANTIEDLQGRGGSVAEDHVVELVLRGSRGDVFHADPTSVLDEVRRLVRQFLDRPDP